MASTPKRFAGTIGPRLEFERPLDGDALLRKLWWAQRHRMAGGMTAGAVWMGAIAMVPVAMGRVVDSGVAQQSVRSFIFWTTAVAGLYLLEAVVWPIRHRFAMGLYERTLRWCHELVGERVLDPRGGLDDVYTPGELTSLITIDSRRVAALLDISCRGTGSVVTFVGVVGAMLVVNWQLAVLVLAGLLPLLYLMGRVMRSLERQNHALNRRLADSSAIAADFMTALRVVKGVGAEQEAIGAYERSTEQIVGSAVSTAKVRARALALDLVMPAVVITIVAWFGAHLVTTGGLSIGQLVMFSGWSVFMVVPLLTFSEVGRKWAAARAGARRLAAAFNVPVADSTSGRIALDSPAGHLTIGHLTLQSGEFVSVHASQHLMARVLDALRRREVPAGADEITVTVDGVPVGDLTVDSLRSTVLVAEHDAILFAGTLRENLRAARPDCSETEMLHALSAAGAQDIVEGLEGGLDGTVAEQGRSLSGGQRQRIALARAYLANAAVLVLVDPTSALDSFTEAEIVDHIRAMRTGRTTLVFTSSKALAAVADRVIELTDEQVAA
jgi:putative ABC transport system ATP-binding protein